MKITVITDERGNIVGTAGKRASTKPEAGTGGPIAGPGQSVREIELPKELVGVEDAAELYPKLQEHLKK
ncbi:hypothetical protein [Mycobacterium florentinum]|nr:hypothetical protein [Mycobacterium florentinum]MCV7413090.1 hypothetical protein [Mycobacterium florentinum]BBX76610.1 hypothetical protein MFLOJ_03970 [Mycobacterium florentinum]